MRVIKLLLCNFSDAMTTKIDGVQNDAILALLLEAVNFVS
jgi:hypothetical protein